MQKALCGQLMMTLMCISGCDGTPSKIGANSANASADLASEAEAIDIAEENSKHIDDSLLTSSLEKLSKLPTGKETCPELFGKSNTQEDLTSLIQGCISRSVGKTLYMPGGVFYINSPVYVKSNTAIISDGKSLSSAPCTDDDSTCFQMRALPTAEGVGRSGLLRLEGSQIVLSHIIVDGSKSTRKTQDAGRGCQAGDNAQGFTSSALGENILFKNGVLKNTLCGTALEVHGGTKAFHFLNNRVVEGGDNRARSLWADGVTVHDASHSSFANNTFIDNTDVQLVFGGCQDCTIANNNFLHTSSHNRAAFAELMIHAWPGGSGDYSRTTVKDNSIDCGSERLCGYGIIVGGDSWYLNTPAFGVNIVNNRVSNAMIGISVDEATGQIHILDNVVENGVKAQFQCHQDNTKRRTTMLYNVAPNSLKYLTADSRKQYNAMLASAGPEAVTSVDFDYCIPVTGLFNATPFEPTPVPPVVKPPAPLADNDSTAESYRSTTEAHRAKVVSLMLTVLERKYANAVGDASGIEYWVRQMVMGLSASEVEAHLRASTEYFVKEAYKSYLKRKAAFTEIEYWMLEIDSGRMSKAQLVGEFQEICSNNTNGECT